MPQRTRSIITLKRQSVDWLEAECDILASSYSEALFESESGGFYFQQIPEWERLAIGRNRVKDLIERLKNNEPYPHNTMLHQFAGRLRRGISMQNLKLSVEIFYPVLEEQAKSSLLTEVELRDFILLKAKQETQLLLASIAAAFIEVNIATETLEVRL